MTEFEVFHSTGVRLYRAGELDLAEQVLRQALVVKPGDAEAEWALAHTLLKTGRFAEGWPLLRARKILRPDNCKPPTTDFPEWTGEPLAGKRLLVMSEQGRGDQIMFARFARLLREQGATVTLVAWHDVAPVLAHLGDWIIPIGEDARGVGIPAQDYWSHYFSLPEYLGITLETLPSTSYLTGLPERAVAERFQGRVGFFWQTRDPVRNLPQPLVRRLLGAGLVSLQPEDTGAGDFADTAAIIARLDLVVTIDTAIAHLAGAMGKPVWVLIPGSSDWRWMERRIDSPWYPTARLFRQTRGEGWGSVVDDVLAALAERKVGQP